MDFGDELAAAWNTHDVENLIRLFAPTCRYSDTPFRLTWEGHEGIRKMSRRHVRLPPELHIHSHERVPRRQPLCMGVDHGRDNHGWQYLTYSGVSVGTLDDNGLIAENRDYWNPKDVPGLAS